MPPNSAGLSRRLSTARPEGVQNRRLRSRSKGQTSPSERRGTGQMNSRGEESRTQRTTDFCSGGSSVAVSVKGVALDRERPGLQQPCQCVPSRNHPAINSQRAYTDTAPNGRPDWRRLRAWQPLCMSRRTTRPLRSIRIRDITVVNGLRRASHLILATDSG
ncbi:hypothetical protein P154DRAFT_577591 [Amniculicola lignicola CBS 123094]|uniref:Uncharacterized protein n=1 Tax=Amniculicola lignicola CBS 123094 TaxID=1392246 RepID=A0A6A5WBC3_9PLEO|nr:hypothetical protein P154DRAFT_577591 [Amniculicola lignicola CBS 123094]